MSEVKGTKIVETLVIPFIAESKIADDLRKNKIHEEQAECHIVLEQMSSDLAESGDSDGSNTEAQIIEDTLFFKCFPTKDVTVMASFGSVKVAEETRTDSIVDIIAFGGTTSSLLKYPEAKDVVITPLGNVIKEVIAQFDSSLYKKGDVMELRVITPSFEFNKETNSIDAKEGSSTVEIYGHCKVEYKSDYRIIKYKPDFTKLTERTRNDKKKKGKSDKLYAGTIYAYRLFEKKTFAVSQDVEVDKVKTPEYARVYSKIVLDEDGSHEAPDGWPDTKTIETTDGVERKFNYLEKNGTKQKEELDPDMSFTDQRTHLIVNIDMYGNLIYEYQHHWLLDPFDDKKIPCELKDAPDAKTHLNPKKPDFFLKFASPPGGAKTKSAEEFIFEMMNTTWRDIFLIPDKKKFKEKIKDYYGEMKGIEEE